MPEAEIAKAVPMVVRHSDLARAAARARSHPRWSRRHRCSEAAATQLLDLMLEFFADDGHWTRGSYDDGNGGHCLVGALLHLSRKHRLPTPPAIALLQDAMPRPGLPLVHFNDTRHWPSLPLHAPSTK
jgi:hypothetical protein